MQGNTPQSTRMAFLPLSNSPNIKPLPFNPEHVNFPAQAQDAALIRQENRSASQTSSRAVDNATALLKKMGR